jgi:hypothetical protein
MSIPAQRIDELLSRLLIAPVARRLACRRIIVLAPEHGPKLMPSASSLMEALERPRRRRIARRVGSASAANERSMSV